VGVNFLRKRKEESFFVPIFAPIYGTHSDISTFISLCLLRSEQILRDIFCMKPEYRIFQLCISICENSTQDFGNEYV